MIKATIRYYDYMYSSGNTDGNQVQACLSAIGAVVKSTKRRNRDLAGDYNVIVKVKADFRDWEYFHAFIKEVNKMTNFPVEVVKVKQSLFHNFWD